MKIRESFVANSSSSSFILIETEAGILFESGDTEMECCTHDSMPIDVLIAKLQEAKTNGATTVILSSGGGYEG